MHSGVRAKTEPILPPAIWRQAGRATSSGFGPGGQFRQNRASARIGSNRRPERLLGLTLSPDSDSGILGDGKTSFATVDLLGLTTPNTVVSLNTGATTIADASGSFLFSNLALTPGSTQFTATVGAANAPSNQHRITIRLLGDSENPLLTWNAIALRTLRRDQAGSLEASRTLAILHTALFDAVNALSPVPTRSYRPVPPPPPNGSAEAAAAGAAHRVLTQLYPTQTAALDAAPAHSLDQSQADTSFEQTGAAFGATVATTLLSERSQDGTNQPGSFKPLIQPGAWRPTPPRFLAAAAVNWPQVKPFLLKSGSQFRPSAPPKLTSSSYSRDFNQVKRLGQLESPDRTPQQTATARFWLGNAGTLTFPGMWNTAAANLLADWDDSGVPKDLAGLLPQARLFAQLNLALADAGIATWDAKYTYRTWRPITAIRLAGGDGNPKTRANPTWQSLLETPAHPDFVSAHSAYAGAASAVLDQALGQTNPRFTSLDFPGFQRSFASFTKAAEQAGLSRIYGGIHTRTANRSGLKLGQTIGRYVLRQI